MSGKIILDRVIPAREQTSLELHQGETLRVIDLEGKQVVDLVALSASDKGEKLSCVYSNLLNGTWKLTEGHTLFSNRANPVLFIKEDRVGLHYSGGGFCTEEVNYLRFKVHDTKNCAENLTEAFRPYGINREDFDFDCCFNIFMNLTFQPDGSMKLEEPLSGPGDYVDLRAEMDTIIAISNCPQDRNPCNAFKPTPTQIRVFEE
jgi:uncharacterized protein YcgI (DUF1989 family)